VVVVQVDEIGGLLPAWMAVVIQVDENGLPGRPSSTTRQAHRDSPR
jgi:hypothetical protein